MIKVLLLIISVAFTILLLNACKKEPEQVITFPHKMYLVGVTQKSEPRMFTHGIEITDSTTIANFIGDCYFFKIQPGPIPKTDTICFADDSHVLFYSNGQTFYMNKTDDLFVFYSESDIVCSYLDQFVRLIDTCLKYKYPKIPTTQGTSLSYYATKEVRVGHGDFNSLDISGISYLLKLGSWQTGSGNLLNEFYEGGISQVRENDTLAILEYAYNFRAY
jgi:hypothetical protein